MSCPLPLVKMTGWATGRWLHTVCGFSTGAHGQATTWPVTVPVRGDGPFGNLYAPQAAAAARVTASATPTITILIKGQNAAPRPYVTWLQ